MTTIVPRLFLELAQSLQGSRLTDGKKLYGTTINLTFQSTLSSQKPIEIWIEWDWRVETTKDILFGSSCSMPEIRDGVASLVGQIVQSIALTECLPELILKFSNGSVLRTMSMTSGNPMWVIESPEAGVLRVENGIIVTCDEKHAPLFEEENLEMELAAATAQRWGTPINVKNEKCVDCKSYVALDGSGHFLDYGACTNVTSVSDGKVVHIHHACKHFAAQNEK